MMGMPNHGWFASTGLFLVIACADPLIVNSDVGPAPTYTSCDAQMPCPTGFVCDEKICKVASAPSDTTTPPPNNCFNVNYPCPAGYVCVAGLCAIAPPDTTTPDCFHPSYPCAAGYVCVAGLCAIAPPDTTTTDVTVPEDIPPPVNECNHPGNDLSCPVAIETCRIDPINGAFLCSGSTTAWPKNTPCTQHEDCDLLYGCHFGVCTNYCQAIQSQSCCDAFGETYKAILTSGWGVCVP